MKKPFKHLFIQNWGTYDVDTLVAVNATTKEMAGFLKKLNPKSWWAKEIECKTIDSYLNGKGAFFLIESDDPKQIGHGTILWLKTWDKSVETRAVLVHELNHAIYHIIEKNRGMERETEAQAYQQEFMFIEIASKLDAALKK